MEEKGFLLPELNEEGQYVVQIKEEYIKTGGHFQAHSFCLDVPAENGVYNMDIKFPIGIGILDAYSYIDVEMGNDEVECVIGENTIVGTLTDDVGIGIDVISVSDTVLQYCDAGFYINLFNGETSEELGRIIEKDLINKTIKLENKTTMSFGNGSMVRFCVKLIPLMVLHSNAKLEFAYKKTGTNYLPANKVFTIKYKNLNNLAKKFVFILEYLY